VTDVARGFLRALVVPIALTGPVVVVDAARDADR
jgi:hypothetical protein